MNAGPLFKVLADAGTLPHELIAPGVGGTEVMDTALGGVLAGFLDGERRRKGGRRIER